MSPEAERQVQRSAQKARYVADDMRMLADDMNMLRGMLGTGQEDFRERLDRLALTLTEEAEAVYDYARQGGSS